jgi:hypothetical protein
MSELSSLFVLAMLSLVVMMRFFSDCENPNHQYRREVNRFASRQAVRARATPSFFVHENEKLSEGSAALHFARVEAAPRVGFIDVEVPSTQK